MGGHLHWNDIPGWFQWRSAQQEAAHRFPEGSRFVEVGNFLGIDCGYGDLISLIVADSVTASTFFPDRSIDWVHLDARHDREHVNR